MYWCKRKRFDNKFPKESICYVTHFLLILLIPEEKKCCQHKRNLKPSCTFLSILSVLWEMYANNVNMLTALQCQLYVDNMSLASHFCFGNVHYPGKTRRLAFTCIYWIKLHWVILRSSDISQSAIWTPPSPASVPTNVKSSLHITSNIPPIPTIRCNTKK